MKEILKNFCYILPLVNMKYIYLIYIFRIEKTNVALLLIKSTFYLNFISFTWEHFLLSDQNDNSTLCLIILFSMIVSHIALCLLILNF